MSQSPHKRTHALKAILEKESSPKGPVLTQLRDDLDPAQDCLPDPLADCLPDSLLDSLPDSFPDGLLGPSPHPASNCTGTQSPSLTAPAPRQSITAMATLLSKEISKSASSLDLDEADLRAWIYLQQSAPSTAMVALLRTMRHLQLDPLSDEISLIQHEDGHWQAHITIEGCCALLNRHPQFDGLTFTQSDTNITGVPEWIECTIYRRDRAVPITVREYLVEVQADKPLWKKMPRRMLRHRALQQCVRLAIT
jgi:hypothetical protein